MGHTGTAIRKSSVKKEEHFGCEKEVGANSVKC